MKLSERFARGAGVQLVKWLLALLLLAAAGYYVADRLFDTTSQEVSRIRNTADSAIKASNAKDTILAGLRQERDSLLERAEVDSLAQARLAGERNRLMVTARTLRRDLSIASTSVDTIRVLVNLSVAQDSTIKVCGLEVETCLQRAHRLDSLFRNSEQARTLLRVDRDSVRKILGDLVSVTHDCKNGQANLLLFKFCKPNPVVTFVAGAFIGGTVACLATKCLSDNPQAVVFRPTDNPEFVK